MNGHMKKEESQVMMLAVNRAMHKADLCGPDVRVGELRVVYRSRTGVATASVKMSLTLHEHATIEEARVQI